MNQKHKSVKDLNKKSWYRLVKVVYVLVFVGILLYLSNFIYSENKPRTHIAKRVDVRCDDGRVLYDMPSSYPSLIDDIIKSQFIVDKCGGDYEVIESHYSDWTTGSWQQVLNLLVPFWIGLALLFEGLRRIFYYIVLGTFIPKNRKIK